MTLGDHCLADLRQAAADFNEAANAPFHTLGPLRLFKTRWTFLHTRLLPPGCPEPTRCTWTSSYKRLCLLQAPNQNASLTSDAIVYTKSLSATQSSVFSMDSGMLWGGAFPLPRGEQRCSAMVCSWGYSAHHDGAKEYGLTLLKLRTKISLPSPRSWFSYALCHSDWEVNLSCRSAPDLW